MKTRTSAKKPNKQSFSWGKWLDEWKLAAYGVVLATKRPKFVLVAVVVFLLFGTLMNLLNNGFASFRLMAAVDLGGKLEIIGGAFLAVFGVGRSFLDWALVFFISLLQGILIGLVVLVWHKKRKADQNAENVQTAGLAAGLAVLSAGCPTCGTTLLMPVIGAISSTGGYALAGAVSGVIFIAAVAVALFALKKIGNEAYVIIVGEDYERRKNGNDKKRGR